MTLAGHPPMLLTLADYYGTLAAARCLGRLGIPITLAESRVLVPARWSRFIGRRVACPHIAQPESFLEWLVDFGQREPGHVLYPTSDDMAWLLALHRERLARHFQLFQPGVEAIYALLNKRRLHAHCQAVGLDVPLTWFPEHEGELERVAAEAPFPVLLKPQTQILFESRLKGQQVERPSELRERYRRFQHGNRYGQALLRYDSGAVRPMVQVFYTQAAQHIYSLSGFVDESGERMVVRGARKVLQRPRKLGIGLCFEEAVVQPELVERLKALCRRVGYHGAFEVEFIHAEGRYLLIDFNPRFYSQMAFDIARGLPLPQLVYEAARGHGEALGAALEQALAWRGNGQHVYCHRVIFELLLRAQGLSGKLSPQEVRTWREWYERHRGQVVDAVLDVEDPAPWVVDVAMHARSYARHPLGFIRTMVLDR